MGQPAINDRQMTDSKEALPPPPDTLHPPGGGWEWGWLAAPLAGLPLLRGCAQHHGKGKPYQSSPTPRPYTPVPELDPLPMVAIALVLARVFLNGRPKKQPTPPGIGPLP